MSQMETSQQGTGDGTEVVAMDSQSPRPSRWQSMMRAPEEQTVRQLRKENAQLQKEIVQLHDTISQHRMHAGDMEHKCQRLLSQLKEQQAKADAQIHQIKKENENLRATCSQMQAELSHRAAAMEKERAAMEDERKSLLDRLTQRDRENARRVAAHTEKFEKKIELLVTAHNEELERFQQSRAQQLKSLDHDHRDRVVAMKEETARIVSDRDNAMKKLKYQQKQDAERSAEQYKAERASLIDSHKNDLKHLREEMATREVEREHQLEEQQKETTRLVADYESQLTQLRQESVEAKAQRQEADESHARERRGLMDRVGELERHIEKSSAALAQHWKLPVKKRGKGSKGSNEAVICREPGELQREW